MPKRVKKDSVRRITRRDFGKLLGVAIAALALATGLLS